MPTSYSPIDETSYTDSTSYDAEAILNGKNNRQEQRYTSQPSDRPTMATRFDDEASGNVTTGNAATASAGTATTTVDDIPKAKPKVNPSATSGFARALKVVTDSRTVRFLGLVFVIFAAYTLLVSISYFANIGSDQSAVLNDDLDPELIGNAGGPFGAWLAHTILYDWLGVGSFILIYYLAACGLGMLKVYRPGFWSLTMRCLLTAIALSIVCGLATYELASPVYWGGLHGHLLNERLITFTGIWGALGVSIIMAGMVIFLYLTELKRICMIFGGKYSQFREHQARRKAERLRMEAEEEAAREIKMREEEAKAREHEAQIRAQESQSAVADATTQPRQESKPSASQLFTPAAPPIKATPTEIQETEENEPDEISVVDDEIPTTEMPLFDNTLADNMECEREEIGTEEEPDEEEYSPLFGNQEDDGQDEALDTIETEEDEEQPLFRDTPTAAINEPGDLYDPTAELSHFKFPSIDLLRAVEHNGQSVDSEEMEENKARITKTLNDYGIPISQIKATVGPTVTLYEIVPAEGVRIAKIKRLEDDIALSLAALGIRIIAPIPGKGTIGIEVPNKDPQTVSMRSIIESEQYANSSMDLPMAMGCTISNDVFMADLCKMPHLLVAGATGMGKSVGLNAIIASLLYKKPPAELKFVLIDPKMVEFSLYAKLERHYLAKLPDEEDAIITDPSKVVATLNSLCVEMDNRYALLKDASMRNIKEYNDRFVHRHLNPEKGHRYLPYIVVIVDEFADLIMTAGKEVETPIARIAQKARAVGIHMILATQRPSTNVITGVIKANFPGRVAFRVFQMVDSRTIIDRPGANQLIGRGDMLFSNNGKIDRVQCAFIDTPEVKAICDAIDCQVGYPHAYELPEYIPETTDGGSLASLGDRDPLFDEAARLVVSTDTASTSSLQRRYSIGYNRPGKIMDQMEAAGIVGPSQGGKPRQVLVDPMTLEHILENN